MPKPKPRPNRLMILGHLPTAERRPEFHTMARSLAHAGYYVLNPARHTAETWIAGKPLALLVADLIEADGVATLDGWRDSRTATLVVAIAQELALPVRPAAAWFVEQTKGRTGNGACCRAGKQAAPSPCPWHPITLAETDADPES